MFSTKNSNSVVGLDVEAGSIAATEVKVNGSSVVARTAIGHQVFEDCRSWLKPSDHVPIMTEFAV